MLDLDAMYEALADAEKGVTQGCSATTKAALARARKALQDQIDAAEGWLATYARDARDYADDVCRGHKKYAEDVEFLFTFWQAFVLGCEDTPAAGIPDDAWEAGYNFGKYGQADDPEDGDEWDEDTFDSGDDDSD